MPLKAGHFSVEIPGHFSAKVNRDAQVTISSNRKDDTCFAT
jgi:hypothetical protein